MEVIDQAEGDDGGNAQHGAGAQLLGDAEPKKRPTMAPPQ